MFTTNKTFQNTMLQFKWKLSKHQPKILSLLIVNVLLALMGGISAGRTFSYIGSTEIQIVHYSIISYLFLGCLLMMIYGSIINAPAEWKVISYLPITRTTAFLSDALFLFVLSSLAALLTFCNVYITAMFHSLTYSGTWFFDVSNGLSITAFIAIASLYFMMSILGYLFVSTGEITKVGMIGLVGIAFWLIFRVQAIPVFVEWLVKNGIWMFTFKCLAIATVFLLLSYLFTRNKEVHV